MKIKQQALCAAICVALTGTTMAATFQVTTNAATGAGSFDAAIIAANQAIGTDTIDLSPISGQTITLDNDLSLITDNVDISGANTTLDANGNSAISAIGISEISISDMTITHGIGAFYNPQPPKASNGRYGLGGGVYLIGFGPGQKREKGGQLNATLDNVTLTENYSYAGGGMFVVGYGLLDIKNSVISNNYALGLDKGPGFQQSGGGVRSKYMNINIDNSTISGNVAALGGGVLAFEGNHHISNTTISENTGIVACGGVCLLTSYEGSIVNSTISGNFAGQAAAGYIGLLESYGNFDIAGTTITGNIANEFGGLVFLPNPTGIITNRMSVISQNTPDDVSTISNQNRMLLKLGQKSNTTNKFHINERLAHNFGPRIGTKPSIKSVSSVNKGSQLGSINFDYTLIGIITPGSTNIQLGAWSQAHLGLDPLLGPLSNNGGDTLTHIPQLGSPLIGAVPSGAAGCGTDLTVDQTGKTRDIGGAGCAPGANKGLAFYPVPALAPLGLGILTLMLGVTGFRRRKAQ